MAPPREMHRPRPVNDSNPASYLYLTRTMDAARACYSGPSQKLVVALDIGTTFSGAAYAFLDPGVVPEIRSVTKQASPLVPDLAQLVTNER